MSRESGKPKPCPECGKVTGHLSSCKKSNENDESQEAEGSVETEEGKKNSEVDTVIKDNGIAEAIFNSEDITRREGVNISDFEDHNFDLRVQEDPRTNEEHISIVVRGDKVNQAFGLEGGLGTASENLLSEEQEEIIRDLVGKEKE